MAFAWSRSMAPHNRQIFLMTFHRAAETFLLPIALKKMAKASHTRSASHRVDSKLSIGSRGQLRSIQRRVEILVPGRCH